VQVKKALRCLPAPRLSNQRFLGIDRIEQLLRADGECRLMETLCLYFQKTGYTFEHVVLATTGFATIEPENIAALLMRDKGSTTTSACDIWAQGLTRYQNSA
jgi:hypothetical protein